MIIRKGPSSDRINRALIFAIEAHAGQYRKGNENMPYVFHCFDVTNEVIHYSGLPKEELEQAIIDAILHDTVEDTEMTVDDIFHHFGSTTAQDIGALSKDPTIKDTNSVSKLIELRENIERIKKEPIRVPAVKLADRTSNLKAFPSMWSWIKIANYLEESSIIAEELGYASEGQKARLLSRIADRRMILSIHSEA